MTRISNSMTRCDAGAEKSGDFFRRFEFAFMSLPVAKAEGMNLKALLSCHRGGGGGVDAAAQENDCLFVGHLYDV